MEDKDTDSHSEDVVGTFSVQDILHDFLKDFICYPNFKYKGDQDEKE